MIGLVPGGTRQVRFRFAEDHRNEALRGRAAEAAVTVKEVKEKVLPPLDDDFARTVGEFDSLEALRAQVQKGLEARRERENRRALEGAVVDALLAAHEFQVPDALVLRQVGHTIEHTRERLRRQGLDPDRLPWDYQKMAASSSRARSGPSAAPCSSRPSPTGRAWPSPMPTSTPRSSASPRPASGRPPPCGA